MKFKALKSFVSGFGTFDADEEYDAKLDKPTTKMWIEHGLIEELKATKPVQTAQPVQEQEPVKIVKKSKKSKKSVTADEN